MAQAVKCTFRSCLLFICASILVLPLVTYILNLSLRTKNNQHLQVLETQHLQVFDLESRHLQVLLSEPIKVVIQSERTTDSHIKRTDIRQTTDNHIKRTGNSTNVTKPLKKFMYLIQTESCLNENLRLPEQFGNPASCLCDVLVLSFKEKCSDTSLPHVEYIFDPTTTWTPGRNVLYRAVMKRERKYLYYTFLDDDITLTFIEKPPFEMNPWRVYEESLLQFRPPVGVLRENLQSQFGKYYNGECKYPSKVDFLPSIWFDALCNSFRSDVIDYLLPYYDKMDKTSIWYSQVYLIMKTDLIFPGQVFNNVNILAGNLLHRPYPRKMHDSNTVRAFLGNLKNEIPAEYREKIEPRIQDWVMNLRSKEFSPFQCSHIPVAMNPLVPYGYLNKTLS